MQPGIGLLQWLVSHKVKKAFLLDSDIEPLLPPTLDGVDLLQGKVRGVTTHLNPKDTKWEGVTATHVPPHVENGLPHALMRMDAEEALTHHHETRDVENAIWRQVMHLDFVCVEELTHKLMEGQAETPMQELNKIKALTWPRS